MMSYFSIPVGIKDSNEVELLSAIKALELSSSYNILMWVSRPVYVHLD
jgi:hypothetical protein